MSVPTPSKQETREGAEPSPAFVEDWARRMASWCCDGHGEDVPEPCPDDEWECLDAEDYEHWRGFVRHLARALAAESRLPTMTGPLAGAVREACDLAEAIYTEWMSTEAARLDRTMLDVSAFPEHVARLRAIADNEDAGPTDAPTGIEQITDHGFWPGDAAYGWERQCSQTVTHGGQRCHCGHPPEAHATMATERPLTDLEVSEQMRTAGKWRKA